MVTNEGFFSGFPTENDASLVVTMASWGGVGSKVQGVYQYQSFVVDVGYVLRFSQYLVAVVLASVSWFWNLI